MLYTKSIMLAIQALRDINQLPEYVNKRRTYSPLVKKIAHTPIFRRVDICKFQIR